MCRLPTAKLVAASRAIVLLAGLGTIAPCASAAKPTALIDDVWSSPELPGRQIRSIAVLPAIAPESYSPTHPLSDAFLSAFRNDGRRWVSPLSAWHALGRSEIERLTLFRAIAGQVRGSGRTNRETSTRLAELLGVDAFILLRVDRWEKIADATDVATIEARAELVLPSGAPLWRIAGQSRVHATPYRASAELPTPAQGNKLIDVISVGGGGTGGSSQGGPGATGPAGTSVSPSGGQGTPPPQSRKTSIVEHKVTPDEAMMRARGSGEPPMTPGQFQQASGQLVAAWADRWPPEWVREGTASRDSAGRQDPKTAKP